MRSVAQIAGSPDDLIESKPSVRAGEPVLRGTRIPARMVAGLVDQGATADELRRDYGLSAEQVEAAVRFARANPRPAASTLPPGLVVERVYVPAD
jgi:uncharacterized protein (DUF433 family)